MKDENKGVQFIQAIDYTFYGFTGVMTQAACWGRTREMLVNHEPSR